MSSSKDDILQLNEGLRSSMAEEVVSWALERFGQRVTLASSFGAEERVYREMCRQMKDVFQGRRPKFIVNPEVLDAPNLRTLKDE